MAPIRPLSLDHVVDERLEGAQLKLVVARVQHERLMAASDPAKAIAISERLHDLLRGPRPFATPLPGLVVQVAGAEAAPAANISAWQYVSEANDWVATVAPDFFSLETLAYRDWSDFCGKLDPLVQAVADVLSPALVQRAGLRYIDELRVKGITKASDWSGRIAPHFLGAAENPDVGPSVVAIQQAVEIQGSDRTKAMLRHGTVRSADGQPAYLLDHDCYTEDGEAFSPDALHVTYDQLHRLALGVFQRAITEDYYGQLRKGE